jgi:hypothetical protein
MRTGKASGSIPAKDRRPQPDLCTVLIHYFLKKGLPTSQSEKSLIIFVRQGENC